MMQLAKKISIDFLLRKPEKPWIGNVRRTFWGFVKLSEKGRNIPKKGSKSKSVPEIEKS